MGKLFWRIFLGLWFGSALLMVGTAFLFAITIERRIPEDFAGSLERFGTAAARAVLAAHESGSRRDTSELLTDLERFHGLRMYFIDKDGKDILGRQVPSIPPALRNSHERAPNPPGNPQEDASNRSVTIPMATKAGDRYQAVIIFSRPPRPPLDFLLKRLLLPVIVSIFLAGIVSAVAARYLVDPISKLQSAAQRLARGEMNYRIGAALDSRRDEFTALGKDFDRMADQIGQLLASQRLLMLDLSHELRSPLARIKVALELARRQSNPGELIERMDRDADRMDSLIGSLLLLARLESPNSKRNQEQLDLSELIAAIVEDAQLESAGSAHYIRALIAPGLAIEGDRELLSRAIENVLRNALRHTPDGSDIQVVVSKESDHVAIRVVDSGKGIPAELAESLFMPFARGEDANKEGVGLGLAITRAAVGQHGGTVVMNSRHPDPGLEVLIRLPISKRV